MTKLVYLDTETTGLDPDLHDVWEIAAITDAGDEYSWMVRPDLTRADPNALKVGGYYERFRSTPFDEDPEEIAATLAILLNNAVIVGSNPAFDQAFLTRWLRRHGQAWAAHYRTADVVTLGWGQLIPSHPEVAGVPPNSHGVSRAFNIEPDDYARHTALGDARWVRDLYQSITKEN